MRRTLIVSVAIGLFAGAAWAQSWDVYKNVPDVNKPDRDGDGIWPDPGDLSCWQATASNLLAGAGYGTGATAQARGDSIYTQMTNDLGWWNMGRADRAINYWLYTYGKNPDSVEFMPTNSYTDVTAFWGLLGSPDYNFLLGELQRCQYVGVGWDQPAHCITLVGGNFDPNVPKQSVWHDSDDGVNGHHDDVYNNTFTPWWNLPNYPAQTANSYVTLCPGLNKPEAAMRQYDVAYYKTDDDQNGNWDNTFREAGMYKDTYADPFWVDDVTVEIGNQFVQDNTKDVWLLVDYYDRQLGRQVDITLIDDAGFSWDPTVTESTDGGQLLFHWALDYQPDWEQIIFPDNTYSTLLGNIKDWDVATYCIPTPGGLMLLTLAGLAVVRRRRA